MITLHKGTKVRQLDGGRLGTLRADIRVDDPSNFTAADGVKLGIVQKASMTKELTQGESNAKLRADLTYLTNSDRVLAGVIDTLNSTATDLDNVDRALAIDTNDVKAKVMEARSLLRPLIAELKTLVKR